MKTEEFFDKTKEFKRQHFKNLLNDDVDVLNENLKWISKILIDENNRLSNFQKKAEILIAIYLGLISVFLGSVLSGFFINLIETDEGTIFLTAGSIFIIVVSCIGFLQLLLITHPKMYDVLDPTLILKSHETKKEWYKDTISDCIYIYRKNLKKIGYASYRIRTSIDCLLLAVFGIVIMLTISNLYLFFSTNETKIIFLIIGLIFGIILLLIFCYFVIINPRDYKKENGDKKMKYELNYWKWELLIAGVLIIVMVIDIFNWNNLTIKWLDSFVFGCLLSLLFFMIFRKHIIKKFKKEKLEKAKLIFKNSAELMFFMALFAPTVYLGLIAMDLNKEATLNVAVDMIRHMYLFFLTYGSALGCGIARYFLTVYM